jgi:hypothetical protein
MRILISISVLIWCLVISCSKEEILDNSPAIEFRSISDEIVVSFDNQVSITIDYQDINGDIGYQDPDIYSLRVKDARLQEYDWYHIPPITPEQQELQVEGTFSVNLNSLFLLGNSDQEVTSFTIQLKDREGNWSNQIVSPEILITDSL